MYSPITVTELVFRASHSTTGGAGEDPWFMGAPPYPSLAYADGTGEAPRPPRTAPGGGTGGNPTETWSNDRMEGL